MTLREMERSPFTPPEVWGGRTAEEVKEFPVDYSLLSSEVFSAGRGPERNFNYELRNVLDVCNNNTEKRQEADVNHRLWNLQPNRKAYGTSLSLYDRNPVTGKVSGDPIADSYAYIARKNNSLMVIADGVNWGDKSMIAARCAVCASINYLNDAVFANFHAIYSTKDALLLMRKAFDVAHESILQHNGGLTTLNITMVLPIHSSTQYAVCSVNVGDSLTYVFSKRYGMNELSVASHDINKERNMKDVGGAIGPVDGSQPYLTNLTFSVTTCESGDIVFQTTDGISDNFDPVVTKLAVPGRRDSTLQSVEEKAEMLPHERHMFAMKGMERVIHEYELVTEHDISAQELCKALSNHVTSLTQPKRLVIENPIYYRRQFKKKERKKIEETIRNAMRPLPGKLDHATVLAYEVGVYRDENSPNRSLDDISSAQESCCVSYRSSVSSTIETSPSLVFESDV